MTDFTVPLEEEPLEIFARRLAEELAGEFTFLTAPQEMWQRVSRGVVTKLGLRTSMLRLGQPGVDDPRIAPVLLYVLPNKVSETEDKG